MLLNLQQQNIRVSSGVNADMMGANNSTTVSGRAIRGKTGRGCDSTQSRDCGGMRKTYLDLAAVALSCPAVLSA